MRLTVQVPGKPRTWTPDGYPDAVFHIRLLSAPRRRQLAREAMAALAQRTGLAVEEVTDRLGQQAVGIAIGRLYATEAVVEWEGVDGEPDDNPEDIEEDIKFRPALLDGLKDESVAFGLYAEIYRLHKDQVEEEKKSSEPGASSTGSECSPATTSPSPPPAATPTENEKPS